MFEVVAENEDFLCRQPFGDPTAGAPDRQQIRRGQRSVPSPPPAEPIDTRERLRVPRVLLQDLAEDPLRLLVVSLLQVELTEGRRGELLRRLDSRLQRAGLRGRCCRAGGART